MFVFVLMGKGERCFAPDARDLADVGGRAKGGDGLYVAGTADVVPAWARRPHALLTYLRLSQLGKCSSD
jgi:hypothetical protein